MTTVNIYQAKTQLSELIRKAREGEEVTIAKAGRPQVKLMPVEEEKSRPIRFDVLKGQAVMADNFDELPPEFEPYV